MAIVHPLPRKVSSLYLPPSLAVGQGSVDGDFWLFSYRLGFGSG